MSVGSRVGMDDTSAPFREDRRNFQKVEEGRSPLAERWTPLLELRHRRSEGAIGREEGGARGHGAARSRW